MTKRDLRIYIRNEKTKHSCKSLNEKSDNICSKILEMPEYQSAATLLLYHPLPDEVNIKSLIDNAFSCDKTVLLPVVKGDELELRKYSPDNLKIGAFDIWEPTGELIVSCNEIELALIPGMAFDKTCQRLGRGKGYYDRLLPKLVNAIKIGICFDFQCLDNLPSEPHDIKMDKVICND